MAVSKQWTLIRSWLRRTYNREVYEFFRDLPDIDDPDISTGRSATKAVCLIGPNDSQGIATIKRQNFEYLKEQAGLKAVTHHEWLEFQDIPKKNKPQIQLWFEEKKSDAYLNNQKSTRKARISFRVLEKWTLENSANSLARKIRDDLARPLFKFRVGKYLALYTDPGRGYEFLLYANSELEAKEVIQKIMAIQGHTPNWEILRINQKPDLPTTPNYETVLGKQIKVDPPRRETTVYFRYAIAKVPPRPEDIPLVDVSGKYVNALYRLDTE